MDLRARAFDPLCGRHSGAAPPEAKNPPRPAILLATLLSLARLCACAEQATSDGAPVVPDGGPRGDRAAPGDGPTAPDGAPPCTPPSPPRDDHVDPCLLAHRPADPRHLSNRTPAATERVTVRLEAQAGDVKKAVLRLWSGLARELTMTREQSAAGLDSFAVELPPSAKPLYYRFVLVDGSATLHLTAGGPSATPPGGADDFVIAPVVQGKTLHYSTDFGQPEILLRQDPSGSYSARPMVSEGPPGAGVSGIGLAGKELFFYLRDQLSGKEDRPPGGGDYRMRPDVDEAWLTRGTLFDVPPETLELGLLDAHTHPYDKVGASFVYDPTPLTSLAPQQGITHALTMISGAASTQKTTLSALHDSQRWLRPLAWVSPQTHTVAEIDDLLANHGFVGLKFHPTVSGYPADGPLMDPFLVLAASHRVPVQIHSATDTNAQLSRIVALAQRHPKVPIVVVHTVLGNLDKTSALAQIKSVPNLYAETSWTNAPSILQAMTVLDSSRTLFGTDATVDGYQQFTLQSIASPEGQYVHTIPQVIAQVKAAAHPDAYANWAHLTAIRLYGWRFRPDPDRYDTDGDGLPDLVDDDDDNDGQPDVVDPAPLDPGR